ncbi:MAG: SGNH/GDSL hydrolase family protein [Gemmatimonadaceae bacterium]
MRRYGCVAAALVAAGSFVPSAAEAQYSGLYFFGDSFTDVGNATGLAFANSIPNPTPPPYAPGRFSNGLVWTEYFAASLGKAASAGPAWLNQGSNYAVGGATTGTLGSFNSPTGMLSQGVTFANQHPGGVAPGGLFVLWGGGNDIIAAAQLASPIAQQLAVQQAVTNIANLAGGLRANFGATNFLVPFLPDIGLAPLYTGDPTHAAIATSLTGLFNQLLGISIAQFNATGANALGWSLNNLVGNILYDAKLGGSRYGITNTTDPCFLSPDPTACSHSLFVDQLHPTNVVEQLIAQSAYNRAVLGQDVAVIPEPATLALTGLGLTVLGLAFRRKRAA